MKRRVLLIGCLAVCAWTAGAAAFTHPGVLSAFEYQHLRKAFAEIHSAAASGKSNAKTQDRLCREIGTATPLLSASQTDCITQTSLIFGIVGLSDATELCTSEPAGGKRITCLLPAYGQLASAAAATYRSDSRLAQIARARGFTGECVWVLADAPDVIADELAMADDLKQMVDEGTAGKVAAFNATARVFAKALSKFSAEAAKEPTQVSLCAHAGVQSVGVAV